MKNIKLCGSLFLGLSCLTAAASTVSNKAHSEIKSPTMNELKAHLNIVVSDKGITISAEAIGLKPGAVHGFHIHEKGECKGPDFKSAGDHFNPGQHQHSGAAAATKHFGDLGNLVASAKGVAKTEVFIPGASTKELNSLRGKSVIIHAKADDQVTQPSGDSGDRIACGIIQ